MKRRLSAASDAGALDLLLDTLCNVFGGIVLIACLLAILPRHNTPPPLLPQYHAETEMVERRIIAGEREIRLLQEEIERLTVEADPVLVALQSRRDSLEKLNERLEKEQIDRERLEHNEAEARAIAASADPMILAQRLEDLRVRKSNAAALNHAIEDKTRFLQQRIENLKDESERISKGRTQAVRFPRERRTTATPYPIILRHNSVYPLHIGREMARNPAVQMISLRPGDDAERANPLPGKGIFLPAVSRDLGVSLEAAAAKRLYATLYLYPDSHQVFVDLRDALAKANLPYGLKFVPRGQELVFSSKGTTPPEL